MKYPVLPTVFEPDSHYHFGLISIGFERRSTHLLRSGLRADDLVAVPFDSHQVLSYADNRALALSRGCRVVDIDEVDFSAALRRALVSSVSVGADEIRIAVDISSMTRGRLARTVVEIERLADDLARQVEADFFYSPASYTAPPRGAGGVLNAGPVTDEFRGHLRRTSLPIAAVIGLGYEPQRALGAFELLEPTRAWAFRPDNDDARYETALDDANQQLLKLLSSDSVLNYSLDRGAELVYSLDSFLYAISGEYRVVLIPLGPKLFALACLIVALDDSESRPAVWRVGDVAYASPANIEEAGPIVGTRVIFSAPVVAT